MSSTPKRARKPPKKLVVDNVVPPVEAPPAVVPGVVAMAKKVPAVPVAPPPPPPPVEDMMAHLKSISGQVLANQHHVVDHNYCRPWNRHPDPDMKCRPAKYLFMKNFPRKERPLVLNVNDIDVEKVDPPPEDTLIREATKIVNMTPISAITTGNQEKPLPNKAGWSNTMHKLWNKSVRILHSHRLSALSMAGQYNEVLQERTLLEKSTSKFRFLFASSALWDVSLLNWLRITLSEHVCGSYFNIYHECMQMLRAKVPSLVDKFYPSVKKILKPDAVGTVLNNCRPKRIPQSPLFVIVPDGPRQPAQAASCHFTSARMKHWHGLFGSLGKVVTIPCGSKSRYRVSDTLREIRLLVREQIRDAKKKTALRPIVLVGFGESSLIACHCSLDHPKDINAVICLGFPLTAINGFRGDLDDPLLDITVPTLFVIGANSSKSSLDDVEDFRERITRAETGLIVVGGANDRLIVNGAKKKWDGINQAIVDRCLADEVSEFISSINSSSSAPSPVPSLSMSSQ